MLIFAARNVFEYYYPKDRWKNEIAKTFKGDWSLGEGSRGKIFLQIYKDAKAGVILAYKNSKANKSNFVHRNWMRSKDTPNEVASVLKDIILPMREPIASLDE